MRLSDLKGLLPWASLLLASLSSAQCPLYQDYAAQGHEPFTEGKWNLSYARPIAPCRTFYSPDVEDTIERLRDVIKDPDLFRLFENSWPSTLDTTIAWQGWSNSTSGLNELDGPHMSLKPEELTFVITGDIEAMWLRDSANQLQAYTSVLKKDSSPNSIASLFRGAINLQARYILENAFCNAFQAPAESGILHKSSRNSDRITPPYDYFKVFSCQWELDSLASFLQLSTDYVTATHDYDFFQNASNWTKAVEVVLDTAQSMMIDSYTEEGEWQHTPYTYCAPYGGTPINDCNGSPHKGNIGLIRSFHRPSDDACTYQYLIPSNMMFSSALNTSSTIMARIESLSPSSPNNLNHTTRMRDMSTGINRGIEKHGIVNDPKYGKIYAYEVDGYGSANVMDDPNVPSLLSAPFLGYTTSHDPIYSNTRNKILSRDNSYYAVGPVITGVGSPHTLPGRPWPMALIMAILTSEDDEEIKRNLKWLLQSTDGLGLMHESVHARQEGVWSRQWFSWANGLFGQMVLDLERRRPGILGMDFQV
ncbi:glycoside hydrolase family 125 protein [Stemphylium lycopersici]|uniref:Glycoside hydrolase family 125 protein n=1 Tax=Stemphylium lycopersici TaxID=183478 RepID=A0A364NBB8_STELY|nr:glycoside hydrolase family 125 protein [Stemphylium lycopersici]RAR10713.1 glycoside hydrolase family 125 protein [Stemphylium lycopersici]RAR14609.1 glycoside hydrolase family 125 protein [Stemphylium lycopersici]